MSIKVNDDIKIDDKVEGMIVNKNVKLFVSDNFY